MRGGDRHARHLTDQIYVSHYTFRSNYLHYGDYTFCSNYIMNVIISQLMNETKLP